MNGAAMSLQPASVPDALLPREPGGLAPGAGLALLVHLGLLAALAYSVDWRTHTDTVVAAELWAAVPQVAAPRAATPPPKPAPAPTPAPPPPPPPPPPAAAAPQQPPAPDPQIAIEQVRRERQRELEREQALERERQRAREQAERREAQARERQLEQERQAQAQAEADKARRAAAARKEEEARLARQREDNLRRMLGQVPAAEGGGPETSSGVAARSAAPSRAYAARLVAAIKSNVVFTDSLAGNPAAEVEVSAAPSGTIIARRLVRSSGSPEWDAAVLRAIDRTGTLPRDTDGRVPGSIRIIFRPND